ncbi:MAG: glycoside hydrolase family 2 [Coprobacter sp.]|nr:glycoside hydrolase family 2 [Coprobacter sp.]
MIKHIFTLCISFFISCFVASAQLREVIPLVDGWQFAKGAVPLTELSSMDWETVSVPHCWNAHDATSPDYYRGEAVYRCTFPTSKKIRGKRIFIRFEAVSQEAKVYINGTLLGEHQGAFGAFCFEITPYIKKGNNEIVVMASNAHNDDIAPLAGDFTKFGGIYRPVSLLILPHNCITPLDYASSGVYLTPTSVSDTRAVVDVKVKVDATPAASISLRTTVYAPDGNPLAVVTTDDYTDCEQSREYNSNIIIENPQLWDGLNAPHRYRFFCELLQEGRVVDTLSQYTGLRYYTIDAEKGFFLNGKSYPIRGVNRHQDRPGKGWAISNADHDEDMRLIQEIGANGVRLAHYPQSDYIYTLCDRAGMLVWAEIPFIERATDGSKVFADNLKQQLVEMIRQNYNHPSIFCWGLFNELGKGHPEGLVAELNALAHKEDPTRITVAAANNDGRPENTVPDYLAHNTYPGWYWAGPETMGPSIDWKNDGKGVCISEYGAGASVSHHKQGVTSAPKTDGDFHPEEWQATVHEGNYREITKRDFVWGTFVWNMFDFASATRHEGDAPGINDKGLVTYDRKTPKDAFYFYKANWSRHPVVYITSRRHDRRHEAVTDVKVYSNCQNVTLTVNGVSLPLVDSDHNVYIWKNITLLPGENQISVSAVSAGKTYTDRCVWYYENE